MSPCAPWAYTPGVIGVRHTPSQTDRGVPFSRLCDQGKITKSFQGSYGRLIDFLSQISKLSHFNLLDLAAFYFTCITRFPFRFLMWQPWVCADTTAHLSL